MEKLFDPVSKVMTTDVITVRIHDPFDLAMGYMRELNISVLPVLERDDGYAGVIGLRDIIRGLTASVSPREALVGDFHRRRTWTVAADDTLATAVNTMIRHKLHRLPVIRGPRLLGIVTTSDILRHFARDHPYRHFTPALLTEAP